MLVNDSIIKFLEDNMDLSLLSRARTYVNQGRVNIYKIEYKDDLNFKLYSRVKGSTSSYNILVLVEEGKIEDFKCACPYYDTNYYYCKHIVATIIEFNENKEYAKRMLIPQKNSNNTSSEDLNKIYMERKYQDSLRILNLFNDIDSEDNVDIINEYTEIKNGNVKVVPQLIFDRFEDKVKVEFSVGLKQQYKIKDLVEFMDNVEKNKVYKYGSKLEFIHNMGSFDESSQELVRFILKYSKIIKYANDNTTVRYNYYGSQQKVLGVSSIKLDSISFDELFNILVNSNVKIERYHYTQDYTFLDGEPEIKFNIKKLNETEYGLINETPIKYEMYKTDYHAYLFVDNNLYRCSEGFSKNTIKILDIYSQNQTNEITFRKDDLSSLFSLVVPKIKNNINLDEFKNTEIEKYIPQDLFVKIYLDYNSKHNIEANIKFCYGEIEFNPYEKSEELTIVRNIVQEKRAYVTFSKTGFEQDKQKNILVLKDDDKIYDFLNSGVNEYTNKYQVMVSDEFKSKQIRQAKLGNIGVKIENNLLNIELSGFDFDRSELKDILKKYNIKKKYHRLKDGSFLKLEENSDIAFIDNLVDGMDLDYKELSSGEINVPIYRSIYLEKLLDNIKNTQITRNYNYKNIINKTLDREFDEKIILPTEFENVLRNYQKIGYKWLKIIDEYNFGGILADDMGLGKTLQIIAIISDYVNNSKEDKKTSIVVCPSSLTLNWENEIKKFSSNISTLVINGKLEERKQKIDLIDKYDLIVTSYDLLKRDIDIYKEKNYIFKYIIADEAQYIKNSSTQNAIALKSINAQTRFALTGTPIENSLSELWSIFDYVMPRYLFNYSKFKSNYEMPIVKEEDGEKLDRLKTLIQPFILRRLKKEVLTELPDKTITILNNEMDDEQKRIYFSHLMKAKQDLQDEINSNGFEKSQIKILAILTRLRQICCHPSLFIDNYNGKSSKLNQCIEIVKDATESGHKVLLFSQFTSMFEILEKEFKKEKINYYKLTGSTKVQERMQLVNDFNTNENIDVFLISLKAGGTGLNLTGADVVIHYDPWWNLSAENQATDRAYRIGQKNNVQVYKLITKDSIEEKINELQEKKSKLTENMLSTEETFINKLSKEDIMNLFE
ncbi:MAG: DEAD/DEAH box helicase [Clostridia bacterium]|nr:DEAD/DEAH box helicase [Clostridia bacterium]